MAVANYLSRYQRYNDRNAKKERFFFGADPNNEIPKSLNRFFPAPFPKPFMDDGSLNLTFLMVAALVGGGLYYYFFMYRKQAEEAMGVFDYVPEAPVI